MEKILVVHNRYNILGGEDIAVEKELALLKEFYKVETLYFENNITNYLISIIFGCIVGFVLLQIYSRKFSF